MLVFHSYDQIVYGTVNFKKEIFLDDPDLITHALKINWIITEEKN